MRLSSLSRACSHIDAFTIDVRATLHELQDEVDIDLYMRSALACRADTLSCSFSRSYAPHCSCTPSKQKIANHSFGYACT